MSGWCRVVLLAVAVMPRVALGQMLKFTDAQIQALRQLSREEPGVRVLADGVIKAADEALGQEPRPIEAIIYEGRLDNDPQRIKSTAALEDMARVHALAMAHLLTGEQKYAVKARAYVLAWASEYKPTGNPINENKFDPLLLAYGALRDGFEKADRERVDGWLRTMAQANIASADRGQSTHNNWQTKRLKMVATIGWTISEPKFVQWAMDGYDRFIEQNLHPDGTSEDLKQRDALHYHCSGLRSLVELGLRARQHGVDLFSREARTGASLRKSVDYMLPYARGEKVHPEWVHSKVPLDRCRAEAGLEKYRPGKPWDPRQAIGIFEQMAVVDQSCGRLSQTLRKTDARLSSWEGVLVAVLEAGAPATQPGSTTRPR